MLEIGKRKRLLPLERVTVLGAGSGTISVRDGEGREYVRIAARQRVTFRAGGALGTHLVALENASGRIVETATFKVDCKTGIDDRGGRFNELLSMLHRTMIAFNEPRFTVFRGRLYRYFVCWVRDHVHTLKGMKYFDPWVKSGMELYRDSQRSDGMIFDNVYPRPAGPTEWDAILASRNFILPVDDEKIEFRRIPVENDVEYLYVEGIYYTWKACGDDSWMASMLPSAVKAFEYSQKDPFRWSRKFKLLKRPFTIDTWDYKCEAEVRPDEHWVNFLDAKLGVTRFGIMHGDNTGFAASCRYLAEMLEHAGRAPEASNYRKLGKEIQKRLNKVSWNGRFFTHRVPENPKREPDLGVDQSKQLSLSNAYNLNRDISHKQCVSIIREYLRLRRNLPQGSPAEWYSIYPPFPTGFNRVSPPGTYVNGAVLTIVAGELAHGAFEHGYEGYGVDILERLSKMAKDSGGHLHCSLRGVMPQPPRRKFETINLASFANVPFPGKGGMSLAGWRILGDADFRRFPTGRRKFADIPFLVTDPRKNGRKACVGLSPKKGYAAEAAISVGEKARSIYLLHTGVVPSTAGVSVGSVTLVYSDGTKFSQDVTSAHEIANWQLPVLQPASTSRGGPQMVLAWRGKNGNFPPANVFAYGFDNPNPAKKISKIEFAVAKGDSIWFVLGVTLCDKDVFFEFSGKSSGIPDNWGAAAVVYALIEGLAGIKDTGVGYDRALIAPRWEAAEVGSVTATAKYESSGGYVRYRYSYDKKKKRLSLEFTGTAEKFDLEILLPARVGVASASLDGTGKKAEVKRIEKSRYACFSVSGVGVHRLVLSLT